MKLSEIKYSKIVASTTPLSEVNGFYNYEDIQSIVFEKENNHVAQKCDIGFIFGGISMIPYRVEKGIFLYQNGLVDRLVVSGGVGYQNFDRKIPEAISMYQYLRRKGIPKEDIIVEEKSRNTIQNIHNFFDYLEYGHEDFQNMTYALITSDFHLKRCLALFSKELGRKDTLFGCEVCDGITDIHSWKNTLYGKKQILREAIALCFYAKQGRIDNLEISEIEQELKRAR